MRTRLVIGVAITSIACSKHDNTIPIITVRGDSVARRIEQKLPRLRHDTATIFGLSAEGATVTASYEGTALRRLRAEYLGESGRTTESFYFDSSLVFVTTSEYRYDRPMTGRVVDSTTRRVDLTLPATPRATRDSLRAEAESLLARMKKA